MTNSNELIVTEKIAKVETKLDYLTDKLTKHMEEDERRLGLMLKLQGGLVLCFLGPQLPWDVILKTIMAIA
jgi:hypothetical protein